MSYYVVGTMIVGALVNAQNAKTQASANQAIANNNAAVAEMQAQDAITRGEEEAQASTRRARQLAGAQRAAFSARGVDISDGTAADVIDQTDFFAQVDATTARNNAKKEAWNRRAGKRGYEIEARVNNPSTAFNNTLLAGAGTVAQQWYRKG